MKRLTEKNIKIRGFSKEACIYNKLFDLEDIEEELGCPLAVLFEAIKNGIYFTNEDNELEYIDEALAFNRKITNNKFVFDNYGFRCLNKEKGKSDEIYLEDYGVTWWLKENKEK